MSFGIFTREQDKKIATLQAAVTYEQDIRQLLEAQLRRAERELLDTEAQARRLDSFHKGMVEIVTHVLELRKHVSALDSRLADALLREQGRFNALLQQFVNLAAAKGGQPATARRDPVLADMVGLFEEVQVGDERGYKTEELELDGMSNDSKPATE